MLVVLAVAIFSFALGRFWPNCRSFLITLKKPKFSSIINEDMKMALVVRTDLNMKSGKIAAQCCHAAVGVYCKLQKSNPKLNAQPKIVLKIPDERSLVDIMHKAKSLGLCTVLITDAGRTQVPSGSKTVLAVGPGPSQIINECTGHLKLL
ncbi:peptidyl-tRNA hydrolase 2, mitochondrial-like isoform X2 [Zophobas morio]|uniref:peptidyl-tRNA hydrolase 2, mitochondrial-like isoform X2 n=1 Tax=Zophobas morio TaxID=2755281 RepID=UPI0030830949